MTKLPKTAERCNSQPLQMRLEEIIQFIQVAVHENQAVHEVEERLWRRVLKLGRDAMQVFFDQHGDGDEGEYVTSAESTRDSACCYMPLMPITRPW